MADMRFICVIITAFLTVAPTAKADSNAGNDDTAEFRDLLGAMKRYLHAKTDKLRKSNRASAYDDVRAVYSECKN